ncbi:MAG: hypothetical protein AUJ85_07875 [Elusimicrobia bacterium CG1_02_37_114]|nr:MAG: hypothetical protein AUJ85_07875 [Elusimicrobia bacterium CG1_02_37_114]PIV53705.1 MAG: hypothetical protein COS17_02485 [Elusimicrobia bacterium CG02_land_8_20_14_3_00_37_13]PIZ13207.1 MAG: hypothetical protein COY53_06000 [Elusimicrobia bacterium CG_4_10_14_0_8_um_filter_37_32]
MKKNIREYFRNLKVAATLLVAVPILSGRYPVSGYAEEKTLRREFDLTQSVFYAQRNRKEVLLAQKEIEVSRERIKEAISFRYPKIDFGFNYSEVDKNKDYPAITATDLMILPPSFGSLIVPKTTRGQYYFMRFSLWQQLYSGGGFTSNLRLAEKNLTRAESQLKVVTNDINFGVAKSFYELRAIEEKLKQYEIIISTIEKFVPSSWDNPNRERLRAIDLFTKLKSEYLILQNEYRQKKLDFLNTLGLELNTDFVLKSEFKPTVQEFDLNKLAAWAFEYRQEPRQKLLQEEMDALGVKLSLSARSPTITLGAHYEYADENMNFSNRNWNTTLNFNVPIFDGWASGSRVRQKSLQLEQGQLRRKDIEDSIRLELRKSYNDYNFWLKELSEREKKYKQYGEMIESITDATLLMEVYVSRFQAGLDYISAVYEHLVCRASLEHAVGKPLTTE